MGATRLIFASILAFSCQGSLGLSIVALWGAELCNAAEGPRLALLVGCTRYDHLPAHYALQGPANDVLLMRDLLQTRFGFDPANITILSEQAGDATRRPTRANIAREFTRLRELAQRGSQVVVLLAGHGSQQPDQDPPDPRDPEPDGLDEIFLPADAGKWDGGRGEVANAIRDDEIRGWLAGIRGRGATVWAIIDACHSGTLCRGVASEKLREVPLTELAPREVLSRSPPPKTATPLEAPALTGERSDQRIAPVESDLVAIYAAQSTEPTVEQLLPPNSSEGRPYGLLTYTIAQVLTRADSPLTYNDLVERIHAQYQQWGRAFPTPLVEGPDRDREVLGSSVWTPRPRIFLRRQDDEWSIDAGALHGLTNDSVLAVYPPPGEPRGTQPLGFVRIVECDVGTSLVEPCDHGDAKADDARLASGASCEVTVLDVGDMRLMVAIDDADHRGRPVDPAERAELAEVLGRASAEPLSLLRLAPAGARPDWLVRMHGGQAFLVPASGVPSSSEGSELPPLYGPAPQGSPRDAWITDRLSRIARARNLIRMAEWFSGESGAEETPRVEVEQRLLRGKADRVGLPLEKDGERIQVHDGDRLALRITNRHDYAVDVTLLYIDAGFGISPLYPQANEVNRLGAGESSGTLRLRVAAPSAGLESLVAITVRSSRGRPIDFVSLAQETLEQAQASERSRAVPAPTAGLGALLRAAAYGQGRTRAVTREEAARYGVQVISWQLVPLPRDASGAP